MAVNIKVSGKVYNGIETISVKNENNVLYDFLLEGATPPPAPSYRDNDVTFIDYDGSIVISYTKTEFLNLSSLPNNPTHTGLVSQGWNWTLSDAKTYVGTHGKLVIGQMYGTESGKTEYDVVINEATSNGVLAFDDYEYTVTVGLDGTEKDWGDGTVNTLESHKYTTAGNYTIKISGNILPNGSAVNFNKQVRAIRIASGVTTIGGGFGPFPYLEYITIPSSVISIDSIADCKVKHVIIPSGVTGACPTFFGNVLLERVSIPNGITYIAGFRRCYNLRVITIPNTVLTIDGETFDLCYSLQEATIGNGVITIGDYAFSWCTSLKEIFLPSSLIEIGLSAFEGCYSLKSIVVPSSVTTFGYNVFGNCQTLQSVTMNAQISELPEETFINCVALEQVTLSNSIRTIKARAFKTCNSLTAISLPNGLTTIEIEAFSSCECLLSITLPSTVTSIGDYAFSTCERLTVVTVLATTPPTIGGTAIFQSTDMDEGRVYVPNGTRADYETDWSSVGVREFVELPPTQN